MENPTSPFTELVDRSFCEQEFSASSPVADIAATEALLEGQDFKKIKTFIRNNNWQPNDAVRTKLWKGLCRLHTSERTSIYNETVSEVFGAGKQSNDVTLPTFVDPTAMHHFHLNPQGVFTAKRIMCVLGTTNPDIIYAPIIFPLTCVLLHYLHEEDAYNALYALVTSKKKFIPQTKVAVKSSKFILKDLSKKYCKGWFNQASRSSVDVDIVMEGWTWWILRALPFTHMVRVIDCYFVEGPKVLYRVALTILNLYSKKSVGNSPAKCTTNALLQFCEDLSIPPTKLLKMAFTLRGLSRKEINKLSVKSEMYVKSMRHSTSPPTLTKSASCESLNLKVSRSFSGPIDLQQRGTGLLGIDETDGKRLVRTRSRSHGEVPPFSLLTSNLVTQRDWQAIWKWLPTRITLRQPKLVYTTSEHGTSLTTFYSCVEEYEPTIMVIKTAKNEVFGAYCSTEWNERKKNTKKNLSYFGTGESFIFSLAPKQTKYEWVGKTLKENTPHSAHFFMAGDYTKITVGGGGGEAIQLDENLDKGRSEKCDTFGNPPLAEGREFSCTALETYAFV